MMGVHSVSRFRDQAHGEYQEASAGMARLGEVPFEWVLPGHGQPVRLPPDAMQRELALLVDRMSLS